MKTLADAGPEPTARAREVEPATAPAPRPLYWSLRRELWENRSIYLAPLGVAAFLVVGLVIHGVTMPSHMPSMLGTDPANPGSAADIYSFATFFMLVTAFVVGAFYSLEALNGERRDRSILFWKSLPVSDRTTVLAKATVPLVILPAVTFVAIVAMQLTLLLLSAAALLVQGLGAGPLWRELQLFRLWLGLLYALVVITLWLAPVYGFLLLVSGWARRTAALWAVLPLLAAGVLEKLTMDTEHVAGFVTYRLLGWYGKAFLAPGREALEFELRRAFTPGRILATPDLWLGLVFAAVCLAAAVRLRRHREPM